MLEARCRRVGTLLYTVIYTKPILFYDIYRQVSSPKLSSDNATKINLRKLLVNAQVTAMTSFIEVMGNVLVIIIVVITKGYGTITMAFFYSIVLPHSLLMNTSHNKYRIIKYGWKNVIKNLFGMSNNSMDHEENLTDKMDNHLPPNQENGNGLEQDNLEKSATSENTGPEEVQQGFKKITAKNECLKKKRGIMKKRNVERGSETTPSCSIESITSKSINKNNEHLVLNKKKCNNLLNTPLNVIDLEKLGDHNLRKKTLGSALTKAREYDDENSMKGSPKRVTFYPPTDKNVGTLTNLEQQSEMLFAFDHKTDELEQRKY